MAFTGKATYSAGSTLPEIAEDISDLVAINSPHETGLLDALGDAQRPARSTVHEWLEDSLLPNSDTISQAGWNDPEADTAFTVDHPERFRVGDQIQQDDRLEVMLVTAVNTGTSQLTVQRGYGGSTAQGLTSAATLRILGNAALEGADAAAARFTTRSRLTNYTQIFAATIEVSGSELAVKQAGVSDELDWQKQQRTRELLRDLENCVINGRSPAANGQGSASVRRTMKGIFGFVSSNVFVPGAGGFPAGALSEEQLNLALRQIWRSSNGRVDLIVVGGSQKRRINTFLAANRRFSAEDERYKSLMSEYESDFGVCRIVLSRAMPPGAVLLLDSGRIDVMPLSGRSFQYQALARSGDRDSGQVVGEYTLELRNENAHGAITGLTV